MDWRNNYPIGSVWSVFDERLIETEVLDHTTHMVWKSRTKMEAPVLYVTTRINGKPLNVTAMYGAETVKVMCRERVV